MFGEAILYRKITFFIHFAANITSVHSLLYYSSFSFFSVLPHIPTRPPSAQPRDPSVSMTDALAIR